MRRVNELAVEKTKHNEVLRTAFTCTVGGKLERATRVGIRVEMTRRSVVIDGTSATISTAGQMTASGRRRLIMTFYPSTPHQLLRTLLLLLLSSSFSLILNLLPSKR
jgi:hypothetical protein